MVQITVDIPRSLSKETINALTYEATAFTQLMADFFEDGDVETIQEIVDFHNSLLSKRLEKLELCFELNNTCYQTTLHMIQSIVPHDNNETIRLMFLSSFISGYQDRINQCNGKSDKTLDTFKFFSCRYSTGHDELKLNSILEVGYDIGRKYNHIQKG